MLESQSTVEFELSDGIAIISLNRPQALNAVIPKLVIELCDAVTRAIAEKARVAILNGKGKAFCAGFDLKYDRSNRTELSHRRELERLQDVTRLIRRADFPVIAAVHGYALGNGCEFALAGDFVVAASDTEFGFPEVSWGLSVTGGISNLLTQAVGPYRAKELLLLGQRFSAEQAYQWGLINRIVPTCRLMDEAIGLARSLGKFPRGALVRAKRAIDFTATTGLEGAFALEIEHAIAAGRSAETHRNIAQFEIHSRNEGKGAT